MVHASFLPAENFRTFNIADVHQIIAYMFEGDDHLAIAGNVSIPAILHGGTDNDVLLAGGSPSVLLGEDGNDLLIGGVGRGILIGGSGGDRLIGGNRDDVMIGGSTNVDEADTALWQLLDEWRADEAYDARSLAVDALISVLEDHESDRLTGSAGRDLWFNGLGDALNDVQLTDQPETIL